MRRRVLALLAAAAAGFAMPVMARAQSADKRATVAPISARSLGSPSAPVTVYEMSDYQCPFCRTHALKTFPALDSAYVRTGKVRWVFINFPLTQLHANAAPAAELAMCAAQQGRFWPVHDLLFRHQPQWAPLRQPGPYLLSLADSAGLNRREVMACLRRRDTRAEIAADAAGAERVGANSTPTFYIEGGLLAGAYPVEIFRKVLDSIYAAKVGAKQ